MPEISLEQVVEERRFVETLQKASDPLFRLSNALMAQEEAGWSKKHFFQLISETQALESCLDDYGARFNRTYSFFTELVASLRGFALAGYSIAHLRGRLESYGIDSTQLRRNGLDLLSGVQAVDAFIHASIRDMVHAVGEEARRLGMEPTTAALPEDGFLPVIAQRKLPRNVDEAELSDERQKIAEVASKYLRACDTLRSLGIRRLTGAEERRKFLAHVCSEEKARFHEATVHNIQSAYDTWIKNTTLESGDGRLPRLRGYASAALHLLEAATQLTHFYERHENDVRSEAAKLRIAMIVDRNRVQEVILNHLLCTADGLMQAGRELADGILPEYTNSREFSVELGPDLELHARPASLIVGIVNHYGTPVEMEIAGKRCNAASILELLVAVGSHPGERRLVFRGDETPLRDIETLFRHDLGENGIDRLPAELAYLRTR